MLANPIIQRELIGTLRTKRAILLQIGIVAVLSMLVILRWPTDSVVTGASAGQTGEQALEVLRVFGYGLMVVVILLAPAFPATSIVREKQQGTLTLLVSSPMTPTSILLGKLGASFGFMVILMFLSLPLAAACYTMGGITFGKLGMLYVVIGLLAIEYITLALYISASSGTTDSALRMTYGGVLLLAVLTLAPHQFIGPYAPPMVANLLDWVRAISPFPAVAEALGQVDIGSRGVLTTVSFSFRFVVMTVLVTGVLVWMTLYRLSRRMLDRPRPQGRITDEASASEQAFRRVLYLWFFDPKRRSGLIGPLTNAVMIKEFRSRRFGRSGWLVRLIAACLIVSLALMLATARGASMFISQEFEGLAQEAAIIVLLQIALIVLLTPSLAAGVISAERESGGWSLLQMTPLSSVRIVSGKLMSVGLVLLLVLLATLPGYVVLLYADLNRTLRVGEVLLTLTLTAVFSLFLSASISSLFPRTAPATAVTYTLLVGLCAGTMLVWLAEGAPFSAQTVEQVVRLNPLAAALQAIDMPGFEREKYLLTPFNWYFMAVASVICLLVLTVQTWRLTRPR